MRFVCVVIIHSFDCVNFCPQDLLDIIRELSDSLNLVPQEIEAAKKEVHSQVSTAMGEELLRLEDQYE